MESKVVKTRREEKLGLDVHLARALKAQRNMQLFWYGWSLGARSTPGHDRDLKFPRSVGATLAADDVIDTHLHPGVRQLPKVALP